MYRNTPVMRAAAVWHDVVGGSETAEKRQIGTITPYGAVAGSACMMELWGLGFSMLLSRMDTPV
eukprot:3203170-Prymnesium_polylepis.1